MSFEVKYSVFDRLVHRLAFSSPGIQLTAANIENAILRSAYGDVRATQPIFVTSLPRAGTTLTLEALHLFPSLATHTYRDMPFVLAPFAWSRLTGAFQKRPEPSERSHGDGMLVGYDSPEAFEEILWRSFWPEKFGHDRIALCGPDDSKDDARHFFLDHMKKIVAVRRPERRGDGRYVSKNNANIARLQLICHMFPDSKILVPVRHPVNHAASLLRQHLNFREMHLREPFSRRYMADVGHYEFGALHRPIAFPGLAEWTGNRDPLTLDYWLGYWIAAFEYVLDHRDKVIVFSYESICADAYAGLERICSLLKISEEGMLDRIADIFRLPSAPPLEVAQADQALRRHAEAVHSVLIET